MHPILFNAFNINAICITYYDYLNLIRTSGLYPALLGFEENVMVDQGCVSSQYILC